MLAMNSRLIIFLSIVLAIAMLPLTGWPLSRSGASLLLIIAMFYSIFRSGWLLRHQSLDINRVALTAFLTVCCGALIMCAMMAGNKHTEPFNTIKEGLSGLALLFLSGILIYNLRNKSQAGEHEHLTKQSVLTSAYFIFSTQLLANLFVWFRA